MYSNDLDADAFCCLKCRAEVKRIFFPLLQKYALPTCRCKNIEHEKELERAARLKRKGELERIYRNSIMNDALKQANFENFIIRPGTETLYTKSKNFAEQFEKQEIGILAYGDPGNGKSHLAAAVHHELDRQGYVCLFIDCSQLFNTTEEARKFSSKISIPEIVRAAIDCDLLTLDELGAAPLTKDEFSDVLFPIINGRQGKKTNYTTNLDLQELNTWLGIDKYNKPLDSKGRLIDRIIGSCEIIKNTATSKRFEDATKRR